jgi:hypothetical protein
MTYLNLVNSVLRRLREDEVTTVEESDYSKLISDFVNDAKRLVEDAWDWTALRSTYTFNTLAGTNTYSLTDFTIRSKVLSVHNETTNRVILQESLARIREKYLANDGAQGGIEYWAIDGVDSNNDMKLRFHMVPNAVNSISVYGVKRTADLSSDTDTTALPTLAIIQFAYAFALRERGETGGQSASEQIIFARQELSNQIALDAGHHPDETIWNN